MVAPSDAFSSRSPSDAFSPRSPSPDSAVDDKSISYWREGLYGLCEESVKLLCKDSGSCSMCSVHSSCSSGNEQAAMNREVTFLYRAQRIAKD